MWFFHDRRLDYCLEFSECKEDFYAIVDYLDSTYSLDGERSFALKYDNEKKLYSLYDLDSKEDIAISEDINAAFISVMDACMTEYRFDYIDIKNGVIEFDVEVRPYMFVYSPEAKPKYERDCLIKKADKNFYHICFS